MWFHTWCTNCMVPNARILYVHRLFGRIISRGKGRGGYHVVGCGRSNYGEKPHTHKVWTRRREKFFSIFSSWPKSPFWPFQNILIEATHTHGMNEAQRNLFKLAQMQRNLHYTQFKKMFWAWSYTQIQGKNEQQNLYWGQSPESEICLRQGAERKFDQRIMSMISLPLFESEFKRIWIKRANVYSHGRYHVPRSEL